MQIFAVQCAVGYSAALAAFLWHLILTRPRRQPMIVVGLSAALILTSALFGMSGWVLAKMLGASMIPEPVVHWNGNPMTAFTALAACGLIGMLLSLAIQRLLVGVNEARR